MSLLIHDRMDRRRGTHVALLLVASCMVLSVTGLATQGVSRAAGDRIGTSVAAPLNGPTYPTDGAAANPASLTVAVFSNVSSGPSPLAVHFGAEVTGGVAPYAFSWSFGDGLSSTASSPLHTFSLTSEQSDTTSSIAFPAPTTTIYGVVLTVTDSADSVATGFIQISVLASNWANGPVVTTTAPVSLISADKVAILGSGFGPTATTIGALYGGLDTEYYDCGVATGSIVIHDFASGADGGIVSSPCNSLHGDWDGLELSWTSGAIDVTSWMLSVSAGDRIAVNIFGPNEDGTAVYLTTALSSSPSIGGAGAAVNFTQSGLPVGPTWYVNLSGRASLSSTGASITILLPNGGYTYTIGTTDKQYAAPGGSITVSGTPVSVPVDFAIVTYSVVLDESGLPGAAYPGPCSDTWYINLTEGPSLFATICGAYTGEVGVEVGTSLPNGTYNYTAASVDKRYSAPGGSFTVAGADVTETVVFSLETYTVDFTEVGLPSGTLWYVNGSGPSSQSGSESSIVEALPNGSYTYTVASAVKLYEAPGGEFSVQGGGTSVLVTFNQVTYPVVFNETGLPSSAGWCVALNSSEQSCPAAGSNATFGLTNGTYHYTLASTTTRYAGAPPTGEFRVNGATMTVHVVFDLVTFTVSFTESGIPLKKLAKDGWMVDFNGTHLHTTQPSISLTGIPNGSYQALITGPSGCRLAGGAGGTLDFRQPWVVSGPTTFHLKFVKGRTVTLSFSQNGLSKSNPQAWGVALGVQGGIYLIPSTTHSYRYLDLTPGIYGFYVAAPVDGQNITQRVGGVAAYGPTGTINLTRTMTVGLTFAYRYSVTFTATGITSGRWSITVKGHTETALWNHTIQFNLTNGTYAYKIGSAVGYKSVGAPPKASVNGAATTITVKFTKKT